MLLLVRAEESRGDGAQPALARGTQGLVGCGLLGRPGAARFGEQALLFRGPERLEGQVVGVEGALRRRRRPWRARIGGGAPPPGDGGGGGAPPLRPGGRGGGGGGGTGCSASPGAAGVRRGRPTHGRSLGRRLPRRLAAGSTR